MMQLAHIALVQWHLFGREDLAVGGDTAVIRGSGERSADAGGRHDPL